MRLQLLKENLHQGVGIVSRLASVKAQLPILSQIGIEATSDGIFLMATDLEVGARVRVRGKVLEEGGVAVPAKLLAELTASLPLGAVEVVSEKTASLTLTAGKVRATLQGMGLAEFPPLFTDKGVEVGDVGVEELQQVLYRVGFCVSRDESRPVLTGILWETARGAWVATDGYRLSLAAAKITPHKEVKIPERLLIGERVLSEGVRAFNELGVTTMKLQLLEASRQVVLRGEDVFFIGRLLEGEYPPYGGIIPGDLSTTATLEKAELLAAVKTAAIFARDSAHIIKISIQKDGVMVSANAPQVGENRIEVEATVEGQDGLTIAFNSRYLSDYLNHVTGERVKAGFTEALRPGVFWEGERKDFQHVIMPVRVREGE